MKKKRKNKGITLIALIITIIVLLILAGVTMSFVVGDNGVLTQAQKAKIRSDQTSAQEEVDIEVVGSYDDEGNLDLELLNKNLMSNLKDLKLKSKTTGKYEDFTESNKIERLPATVYYKQTEVKIKDLLSNVAKNPENYGMYVDYPIDLSGDGDTTNDWKIFYENESGRVFLIAADYVPNTCEQLKKEDGNLVAGMTKSTTSECDKCCYNLSAVSNYTCNDGHGMNSDKPQCSFPEIFMPSGEFCNNHLYCSVGARYGEMNSKYVSRLQCTGEWKNFVESNYAEYAIGGPTIEMWVASWNQTHGKEKDDGNGINLYVDGFEGGYLVGNDLNDLDFGINLIDSDGFNDKLYFPHQDSTNLDLFDDGCDSLKSEGVSEKASCKGYWVASQSCQKLPGASMPGYYLIFAVRSGSLVFAPMGVGDIGLRPIIYLKSGIWVEEGIKVKEDGTVREYCKLVD